MEVEPKVSIGEKGNLFRRWSMVAGFTTLQELDQNTAKHSPFGQSKAFFVEPNTFFWFISLKNILLMASGWVICFDRRKKWIKVVVSV